MSAKEFKQYAPHMEIKNGIYFANRLPRLISIDLSHNRIESKETNHELAMYLSSNTFLTQLDISHNRVTDMNSVGSLQFGDITQILSSIIRTKLNLQYNSIHSLPPFKPEHKFDGLLLLNGNPLAVDMNGHLHNQEFLPEDIVFVCWPYSVTEKEEYLALHAVMADKEQYLNRFPKEIKNIIGEEYSGLPNGANFFSGCFRKLIEEENARVGTARYPLVSNCHPINREKKKGLRKGFCGMVSSLFYL